MNEIHIQYLPHRKIDKTRWDRCIDNADNGLIYGYSFYLDQMAKHWDGLVLKNYEAVMPLTWNKKFGIYYLYQPPFTASLGIFSRAGMAGNGPPGNNLNEQMIKEFVLRIPEKFKFIEISLNYQNIFNEMLYSLLSRDNYILSLNKSYNDLFNGYRENHQRNIQKALKAGFVVKKNVPVTEVVQLNKEQMKRMAAMRPDDYDRFKRLYEVLSARGFTATYSIINRQDVLLASCVFFFSHNRAYYILAGNHPDGRNTGAPHLLIDAFIKDHAGKDLILDFEGSDIESLALFYNGFGAIKEIYPAIRWNRLPWWLRWMKRV